MAKFARKPGSTSQTLNVWIQDSSSTTGAGLTGLAYNTSGLTAYYVRPGGSATAITLATQTVTGAWSSGGFVEISSTNMPGWYRFDVPDACLATGADSVSIHLKGAANMAPCPLEIDLGAQVGLSTDLYHADIALQRQITATTDEYTATWYKNGVRVTSGITSPTVQVVKRSDGSDLVASTSMTQIGTTGSYKYDEATNRQTAGNSYLVIVSATIDGSTRTFSRLVGRDAS